MGEGSTPPFWYPLGFFMADMEVSARATPVRPRRPVSRFGSLVIWYLHILTENIFVRSVL